MVKFLSPVRASKLPTNYDLTDMSQRGILLRLTTRQHINASALQHSGHFIRFGCASAPRGFFIPYCTFPTDGCCGFAADVLVLVPVADRTTIQRHPVGPCTRGADRHTLSVTVGEFDPGSGRTLAACLMHASRTGSSDPVAHG